MTRKFEWFFWVNYGDGPALQARTAVPCSSAVARRARFCSKKLNPPESQLVDTFPSVTC